MVSLLTIYQERKVLQITGRNVWSRIDSPSNIAQDMKFMTIMKTK